MFAVNLAERVDRFAVIEIAHAEIDHLVEDVGRHYKKVYTFITRIQA